MYRIALGYDLHRLVPCVDATITCGGLKIPCSYQIDGAHSDGDVVFHALTDALLSLVHTDIGQVFPNTAKENYQRDSQEFLDYAFKQIKSIYSIVNIDIVIICDAPKIAPHVIPMRQHISSLLNISVDSVAVRGKTTESTRPLSIEAYCNVLFQKK